MLEIAITGFLGVSAAWVSYIMLDNVVRFVNAWRAVRRQLEEMSDN